MKSRTDNDLQFDHQQIKDKLKLTTTKDVGEKKRGPVVVKHIASNATSLSSNNNHQPQIPISSSVCKHQRSPSPNQRNSPTHQSYSLPHDRGRSVSPVNRYRRRSPSPHLEPAISTNELNKRVERAYRARLYLLQKTGPNSFLIGGDSPSHKFRVMIGLQSCSCARGPHCVHILFVMLRVFKLCIDDPLLLSQQLKNYEVEILFQRYNEMRMKKEKPMRGDTEDSNNSSYTLSPSSSDSSVNKLDEQCPICLLDMVDGESLITCNNGCLNRLHQHCANIWAEECLSRGERFSCPLCRAVWTNNTQWPIHHVLTTPHTHTHTHTTTTPADIPVQYIPLTDLLIQNFSSDIVHSLFSSDPLVRGESLQRISDQILTCDPIPSSLLVNCYSVANMMLGCEQEYIVFIQSLRLLRVCVSDKLYSVTDTKSVLKPIINTLISRLVSDSNRISDLSMMTLVEMCKADQGFLNISHSDDCDTDIDYMCDITTTTTTTTTDDTYLLIARLKLIDKIISLFPLSFTIQSASLSEDYQQGLEFQRNMSLLRWCSLCVDHMDECVCRLSERVILSLVRLLVHVAPVFDYVYQWLCEERPECGELRRLIVGVHSRYKQSHMIDTHTHTTSTPLTPPTTPKQHKPLLPHTHIESSFYTEIVSEQGLRRGLYSNTHKLEHTLHKPTTSTISISSSSSSSSKHKHSDDDDESLSLAIAMEMSSHDSEQLPIIPGLSRMNVEDDTILIQTEEVMSAYTEPTHWLKGPLLGTGAFSSCYQARDVNTGTLMAVKQVSFCRNSESEQNKVMSAIQKEILLLAKLHHPNITRLIGSTLHNGHFNLFIEWMSGGSISSLLSTYGEFSEPVILNYLQQTIKGIAYLHRNHIIHRDIKGANLLTDSTGLKLRISDFGTAARLGSHATCGSEFQGQLLGTIAFMAPEVLRGDSYGRSCDIWSIGCTIIEMATAHTPWDAKKVSNHCALMYKIATSTQPPPIPVHISHELSDILLTCVQLSSEDRPTARDLLKHDVFKTC